MRIAIDASPLLLRSAGIKSYLYYWITHLRRLAGKDAIRAFPFLGDWGALDHEHSVLSRWGTWPRLALLEFLNIPWNRAVEWVVSGADVFHVSNQVRNPPTRVRLTATLHDLTCWILPETHTPANVWADGNFAEKVIRKASGVIAVSENTRQDAVRILGLPPERIQVIHPGVPERYFGVTAAESQKVAGEYNLSYPYILFVGTIEPRKNLDVLLDAYEALPTSLRKAYELVIVGPEGWAAEKTVARLRAAQGGIRYLGYVPEKDLPGLTAGAMLFVYPSLYEGFGFPVAQAMACRVPVLTSNISSLPEVTGGAAVLVDPRSPEEVRSGLLRLVENPSLRQQLADKGRVQAGRYRWEDCARKSLDFFEKVVEGASLNLPPERDYNLSSE